MTAFFSYSWFKFKNKISLNLILFYYFWIQNFKMQLSSESKNISNPEQWKKQKNKKKKFPENSLALFFYVILMSSLFSREYTFWRNQNFPCHVNHYIWLFAFLFFFIIQEEQLSLLETCQWIARIRISPHWYVHCVLCHLSRAEI